MTLRALLVLLKKTGHAWWQDNTFRLGASLAFYTAFSLAPVVLIAIGIAGLVFDRAVARKEVVSEIGQTVGADVGTAVDNILSSTQGDSTGVLATVISIIVLVIGATSVFVELQDALNTIWGVKARPNRGVFGVLRDRVLSFAVVVGIGFLSLVSLLVSAGLAALSSYLRPDSPTGGAYLWMGVNFLVSWAFITLLFALMYKVLPDVRLRWRDVWVGSALTALLFSLGKHLIGLYLGQSGVASAYGAAGSLVVVLLWVYYSSQILLFGAEFIQVYANTYGRPTVATEVADPISAKDRLLQGKPKAQVSDGRQPA